MLVSVVAQLVAPAGMRTVVLPVVAVPESVTVPVNGPAFGAAHAMLRTYAPGAPALGAPVTVLVTVTVCAAAISGFVTVMLLLPPEVVANAVGSVSVPQL